MDKIYSLSTSYSLFKGEFNENKYFLFNIEDGTIYRLNEVSYDILSLFDGIRNVEKIIELFIALYQGEQDKMMADLKKLIDIWLDKKILVSGGE